MDEIVKKEILLEVNGVSQRLVIHTRNEANPVLLIIHGHATPTSLFANYYLEKTSVFLANFTIVHWDQRGAGASYQPEHNHLDMSQKQFVDDIDCVVDYLRELYSKDQIHILAQSWGSIIGLRYLNEHPEKIQSYIGEGQAVNYPDFIRCMYDYAIEKAQEKKHLRAQLQLNTLHIPNESNMKYAVRFYSKVKKWSSHFVLQEYKGADLMEEFFTALKDSPYYKGVSAKINLLKSIMYTRHNTIEELLKTDLTKDISQIKVPVCLIMGEKDFLLPATQKFYEKLECESKNLIVMKSAGHVPSLDQTEKFEEEVSAFWESV